MITALQDPILVPRARGEGRTSSESADTSFETFLTSGDATLRSFGAPSDPTGQSSHGVAASPVDIEASAGGGKDARAPDARSRAAATVTGPSASPYAPDYAEKPAASCDKDHSEEPVEPLSFPADALAIAAQSSPSEAPSPRRQDKALGTAEKPETVAQTETAEPAADDEVSRSRRQSPRHSAEPADDSRVRSQTTKAAPDSRAHGSERGDAQLSDSSAPASAPVAARAADAPQPEAPRDDGEAPPVGRQAICRTSYQPPADPGPAARTSPPSVAAPGARPIAGQEAGRSGRALDSAGVPGDFSQKAAEAAEPAAPTAGQGTTQPVFDPGKSHGAPFFPSLAALQVHYSPPEQVSPGVDHAATPASPQRRNRIEPGQVARQIAQGVGNLRAGRIEIVLHPEELGKVRMVMTPGENPSVTIQADNADTLDLLRRNVDQLARELRQSGFGEPSLSFADEGDRRAPLRPALMQAGSGDGQDLPGPVPPDQKAGGGQSRAPQRQLDIRI